MLMTPLTYIAATANLPMQDVALNALDRALGLDWMAYFNFVYHRYALLYVTVLAYSVIGLACVRRADCAGSDRPLSAAAAIHVGFRARAGGDDVISTMVPAMGTYDLFNYLRPIPRSSRPAPISSNCTICRWCAMAVALLDFDALTGIVTFPSFHAAAAVLYLWAFWPVRWIGPIALVANVAMLLATPICGGHYFVDVFAGIAIATASIMTARWIGDWLTRPAKANVTYVPESAVPAE